jgi:pentatricopeptide repeat protein
LHSLESLVGKTHSTRTNSFASSFIHIGHKKLHNHFSSASAQVIALCKNGNFDKALQEFQKAPDAAGAATLIAACGRERRQPEVCFSIYQTLLAHSMPSLAVLKSLANVCNQSKQYGRTLTLWDEMKKYSIRPDSKCFAMFTAACAKTGKRQSFSAILTIC